MCKICDNLISKVGVILLYIYMYFIKCCGKDNLKDNVFFLKKIKMNFEFK